MDGISIKPEFVNRLLELSLKYPVPTRPITIARQAFLVEKFGSRVADKTYKGHSPMLREELTQKQLEIDKMAGKQYQLLLDDILKVNQYVYRYTTRAALNKLRDNGWDIREAFMTNALTENPSVASLGAQLKPEWYSETSGNPDIVIAIPRSMLSLAKVPRPTGNTDVLAGWEFTTSAYPEAGKGGLLQFMGSVKNNVLEAGIKSGEVKIQVLRRGVNRLPKASSSGTK